MYKENCALKLVDEIILYYDARSKKHQNTTGRELTSCYLQNQGAHAKYKSLHIMSSGHSPDIHIKLQKT